MFITSSLGVFGDAASSHSFRAGGLQVVSAHYWVRHTGNSVATAIVTTCSNQAVGILMG
jgi:hypothetical protein